MQKIILALIISCIQTLAMAGEVPVIKMAEIVNVGNVVVKPSAEYLVDLSGYEVPKEANLVIFHVLDAPLSHYYYQEITSGKATYKMTANTLKASTGSPPFNGLKNNDSAFLIIGREIQQGSINMGILYSNESISVIVRD